MSYKAPTPGRFDSRQNTTDYVHPQETNLLSIERAMQYRNDGTPELRVNSTFAGDVVITGNVNVPGVVTVDSSPENPVHVHVTELPSITGNVVVSGNVSISQMPAVAIASLPEVEIKNDTGNPIPISANTSVNSPSNRIYVSQQSDIVLADSNYEFNVARGLVDGQYCEMKNGYAPSMPSTSEGTVWGLNTLYPWSAWDGAGSRLYVASSNAGDVGQTVVIEGLDINFAKISETVTLNGTTAVVTTATFFRINRMYQYTGAVNAGNISARVTSSGGTQVGYMLAGNGRQKSGFFTIPAGYTAYILYGDASSYKNGSGNVSGQVDMFTRTNVNGTVMPFMNQFAAVVANGQYRNEFNVPLRIPEKTDIDVRFHPSGNDTTVSVNWEMILIPN